jgi:hypothetical protein
LNAVGNATRGTVNSDGYTSAVNKAVMMGLVERFKFIAPRSRKGSLYITPYREKFVRSFLK